MGEYLYNSENQSVLKLGTCEDWRYITHAEAVKLKAAGYHYEDWGWALQPEPRKGPRWRIPVDDCSGSDPEAIIETVNGRTMFDQLLQVRAGEGEAIGQIMLEVGVEHTKIQASPTHRSGPTGCNFSIPCPFSGNIVEGIDWYSMPYELPAIGLRMGFDGQFYTVFECPLCQAAFALSPEGIERLRVEILPPEHRSLVSPLVMPETATA